MTTKDIARMAGVSQSTVSRALNNNPNISPETTAKIRRIAEEHGFQFNANARSLSTSRTGTLGIVCPEESDDFSISQYFNALSRCLRRVSVQKSFDLIFTHAQNPIARQDEIQRLVTARKVDGLILIDAALRQETLDFLLESRFPSIFLDRYTPLEGAEDIGRVCADNRRGGFLAAEHLIRRNRHRIVCLTARTQGFDCELRLSGYKQALSEAGLSPFRIFWGDGSFQSGFQAVTEHLDCFRQADAMFAHNDMMAFGAMSALTQAGLQVPDDIALVGYDDIELCSMFHPHLTTVHQPIQEMVELAYEQVSDLILQNKRRRKRDIILEPHLVVRESG